MYNMVEKQGQKIRAGVSPPLFGQCPKENIFFYVRASLIAINLLKKLVWSVHGEDDDFSMWVYILLQFMRQAVIGIGWVHS